MSDETQDFLEGIRGYVTSPEAVNRLGTIDAGYTSGRPRVLFDGESTVGAKAYPYLASYLPRASDRVLLTPMGSTFVVLGTVGTVGTGPSYLPTVTAPDTAPDGLAFLPAANNTFGDGGGLLETVTTYIGGTAWRQQRFTSEQTSLIRARASWAGVWDVWRDGTATGAVTYSGTSSHADTPSGQTSSVSRNGRQALLLVNMTIGTASNQGTTLLTVPTAFAGVAGIRQQGTFMWKGAGVGQNMSGTAVCYMLGNALVFYQWFGGTVSGQLAAGGSLHGSLPYLTA